METEVVQNGNRIVIYPESTDNDRVFLEIDVIKTKDFLKYRIHSSKTILINPRFSNSIDLIIS
jgi:virulence-associated protein VagC